MTTVFAALGQSTNVATTATADAVELAVTVLDVVLIFVLLPSLFDLLFLDDASM